MRPLIPDTSFLVALWDRGDPWHPKALALHHRLDAAGAEYLYLDCVINELFGVMLRRGRERKGGAANPSQIMARLLQAYSPENITWVYPEAPIWWGPCLHLMEESGWQLNLHDALIAWTCLEFGLGGVVSFDQNLGQVKGLRVIGGLEEAENWVKSLEE